MGAESTARLPASAIDMFLRLHCYPSLAMFCPSKQPGNQKQFIRVSSISILGPSKQNHENTPKHYKVFQKGWLEIKTLSLHV